MKDADKGVCVQRDAIISWKNKGPIPTCPPEPHGSTVRPRRDDGNDIVRKLIIQLTTWQSHGRRGEGGGG